MLENNNNKNYISVETIQMRCQVTSWLSIIFVPSMHILMNNRHMFFKLHVVQYSIT